MNTNPATFFTLLFFQIPLTRLLFGRNILGRQKCCQCHVTKLMCWWKDKPEILTSSFFPEWTACFFPFSGNDLFLTLILDPFWYQILTTKPSKWFTSYDQSSSNLEIIQRKQYLHFLVKWNFLKFDKCVVEMMLLTVSQVTLYLCHAQISTWGPLTCWWLLTSVGEQKEQSV